MAERFDLESIGHHENLWRTCLLAPFQRRSLGQTTAFCMMYNLQWKLATFSRIKALSLCLPAFVFKVYVSPRWTQPWVSPAPLWTQRHGWQRQLKPLTACLHMIRPSFRALNPHTRPWLFPKLLRRNTSEKWMRGPHQWGVRNGTIK